MSRADLRHFNVTHQKLNFSSYKKFDLDGKNLTDFQAIICVLTGNKETNHTQKEQMCCFFLQII